MGLLPDLNNPNGCSTATASERPTPDVVPVRSLDGGRDCPELDDARPVGRDAGLALNLHYSGPIGDYRRAQVPSIRCFHPLAKVAGSGRPSAATLMPAWRSRLR